MPVITFDVSTIDRIETVICESPTFPFGGPLSPHTARRGARAGVHAGNYGSTRVYGCDTPVDAWMRLRDADVTAVLDAVRRTGKSAHPPAGVWVSDVVFAVARSRGASPSALQRKVEAYADACDFAARSRIR